jgi:hypothetical protein
MLYSFGLPYLSRVGPISDFDSYLKEPKTLTEAARHIGVRLRSVEELLCVLFYHSVAIPITGGTPLLSLEVETSSSSGVLVGLYIFTLALFGKK